MPDRPVTDRDAPASPLASPQVERLLQTIVVGLVANLSHPVWSCNEGLDFKCFTCEALTAEAALRSLLGVPSGHAGAHDASRDEVGQ